MHAEHVVAEPDQRDPHLAVTFGAWADVDRAAAVRVGTVGDQRGDARQSVLAYGIEGFLSALHWVDPGDQRFRVDRPGGHQPDELLEVALLGPADVPERVVHAALLVAGVVAARPVGA